MEKGIYFKLLVKKAFKIYPGILLITTVIVAAIVLTATLLIQGNANSEEKQKITIGIVGNIDETYLGVGIKALEEFDSSRFSLSFQTMNEEDAIKSLKNREISGYLDIPEDFIEGIYYGSNVPAKYYTLNSPEGFGNILMTEIVKIVSDIVTESQNGIYGMQQIAMDHNKTVGLHSKTEKLNMDYIQYILDRDKSYELDIIGITDSLSMGGYYVCGVLLLFMLLWGISSNKLLGSNNLALSRILTTSGVKVKYQLLCEYGTYLIITVLTLCLMAFLFGVVSSNFDLGIKEIDGATPISCIGFIIGNLPVIIMLTSMHFLFYEIMSGTVSRILVQFLIAVGLGYISGCFYPNYFFPETVQTIADILPSGAGFSYIRGVMSGEFNIGSLAITLIYSLCFIFAIFGARKKRIAGEQG